jgi:hypothetical protein
MVTTNDDTLCGQNLLNVFSKSPHT